MIELVNIQKTFGYNKKYALRDVALKINDGDSLAVIGVEGAGKTTLLNVASGLMPPTSGSVLIDGKDLYLKSQELIRHIGYMPQGLFIYPEMTVREYLSYMCLIKGAKKDGGRLDGIASLCGLEDRQNMLIEDLSSADKVRLRLAQAIAGDTGILMLDEPTFGLKPEDARDIRKILRSIKEKYTVIITTRLLREATELCDNVLILTNGRIALNKSVADFTSGAAALAALRLRLNADEKAAEEFITALSQYGDVKKLPSKEADEANMLITFDAENDIRRMIWQEAVKRNTPIIEMVRKDVSAEEMFLQITGEGNL